MNTQFPDLKMMQLAAAELHKQSGLFWHITLDMGKRPELHFTFEGRESRETGIDGMPISPVIVREQFSITNVDEFGGHIADVGARVSKLVEAHRNALEHRAFFGGATSLWRRFFGGK